MLIFLADVANINLSTQISLDSALEKEKSFKMGEGLSPKNALKIYFQTQNQIFFIYYFFVIMRPLVIIGKCLSRPNIAVKKFATVWS